MLDERDTPVVAKATRGRAKATTPTGDAPMTLTITPPRMMRAVFTIVGRSPLMIAKFSSKAMQAIKEKHEAGSQAKSKKKREARDFNADVEAARHISHDGWDGIHAAAFRNGMIDACRLTDLKMTQARLAIFTIEDGYDRDDGVPLVKIQSNGGYESSIMPVRNASGTLDLRARPMWRDWWMDVHLEFDADLMSLQDIGNLMQRVGLQVGIGEGRPYSSKGNGLGFGRFEIKETQLVEDGPKKG